MPLETMNKRLIWLFEQVEFASCFRSSLVVEWHSNFTNSLQIWRIRKKLTKDQTNTEDEGFWEPNYQTMQFIESNRSKLTENGSVLIWNHGSLQVWEKKKPIYRATKAQKTIEKTKTEQKSNINSFSTKLIN